MKIWEFDIFKETIKELLKLYQEFGFMIGIRGKSIDSVENWIKLHLTRNLEREMN
jgi:hypothetical protein